MALVLLVIGATQASAATIGFDPPAQTVDLGTVATVDIVVSDLGGEIVSAYDLDILYDSSIVSATGVVFTSALGDELFFETLNSSILSAPGVVDFAQLSLLPDDELFGLQGGDSLTVASIVFETVGVGVTDLEFVLDDVNDIKGRLGAILPIDASRGQIRVEGGATQPIPEPSAAMLFFVGGVIAVESLRRRHR